jgi:hypothetical protein
MNDRLAATAARWRWIGRPLAIAVASRVFSIVVLVGVTLAMGRTRNPLTAWDAGWYTQIAAGGYHAGFVSDNRHDFAFFPGWPLVIKVASLGGVLDLDGVAVALANILFVVAAIAIWRLLADRIDERTATGGLALLAFAPPSYAFSMAYSESLFLLVTAACLLATRPWLRAAFAFGAGVTRLAGLALAATGGAVLVLRRSGPRRLYVAMIVGAVAGFAAWFVFAAALTQDPLGFFTGSSSWIRGGVLRHQIDLIRAHELRSLAWFGFVGLLVVGAVLAVRRDLELGAFALLSLGLVILSLAAVSANSIARYALPAFPAYAGLASRLGRKSLAALVVAFAVGEVLFGAWTIGGWRLPP